MKPSVFLAALLLAQSALADPRPARNTADVGHAGSWSTGLFNPLRLAVHDRVELEAHPLVFFVAPNLLARVALLKPEATPEAGRGLRLTGELGLSVPTFGMRLLTGYFFPSWATSGSQVGWMLIPQLGLVLSGDVGAADTWTARVDGAVRVPLGPNSATPLNSFLAPLDLLLAAPLTGGCFRVGGAWDHAFGEVLRLRAEANLYLTGSQGDVRVAGASVGPAAAISPVFITAHLGLDIAVFQQSRVTVGVLWANHDQGATRVVTGADGFSERVRVRSNDFLPTLDYIWAGW